MRVLKKGTFVFGLIGAGDGRKVQLNRRRFFCFLLGPFEHGGLPIG